MTRLIFTILAVCSLGYIQSIEAQRPAEYNSVDIYNKVEKLNVLGTVLYLAAHPDDENTRMISYFANERKTRTAYLSLTRGDGGQNLIGTQIWEKLGLIRTNELVQARGVDGGQQFFSRANDFGYSKHPDETLAFWNKDEVMHDIIKVIRQFKPDIIVNRFDHRTPGRTHGHHTSSAMLSVEAFDIAGDESYLSDRLSHLQAWRPERVFFNTSWWFYGSRDNFEKADKSNLFAVDAGVYYDQRGISNTEIAARSRSMHKSQGFGSTGTRGSEMEYVELVKGSRPTSKEDPLSGIDISWNRVAGGAPIEKKVDQLLSNFNFTSPSKNIPALLEIYDDVSKISDDHWRHIKLAELEDIIVACSGLYLEARSAQQTATRGESVEINIEAVNRSMTSATLDKVTLSNGSMATTGSVSLSPNERHNIQTQLDITGETPHSNPYWLDQPGTMGMYHVEDQMLIGNPISKAAYQATFDLTIEGKKISIDRDVIFKRNDPVDGEVYAPFYITPKASVSFTDPVYIFPDNTAKEISIVVKSYTDNLNGSLQLMHPDSWTVTPAMQDIAIEKKGGEQTITFSVTGPAGQESAVMSLELKTQDGISIKKAITEINYDHIPAQLLLKPATSKFERISLKTKGHNIAYIQGAGDAIPKSLRQIGYDVTEIEAADVSISNLKNYDALVVGIRAYNTSKELLLKRNTILDYMNEGGTVIVQYNTSRRIKGDDIGPYPMELSRERVTDETAEVTFEEPDHELLNYPNKITSKDFEGWVQERGLYFPNKWDDKYAAPLSCHDKDEPARRGGMLVAEVGKGHFIYTGYSWFRELPAGVPGAFRLFANMLSIGKNNVSQSQSTGRDE